MGSKKDFQLGVEIKIIFRGKLQNALDYLVNTIIYFLKNKAVEN
mgnify:CR=1 FL=1